MVAGRQFTQASGRGCHYICQCLSVAVGAAIDNVPHTTASGVTQSRGVRIHSMLQIHYMIYPDNEETDVNSNNKNDAMKSPQQHFKL